MSDLISKNQSLIEWKEDFKGFVEGLDIPRDDYKGIMEYIDEVPSEQPERQTGKWLRSGSDIFPCECDRCGDTNERMTPWCPHCGAKMER